MILMASFPRPGKVEKLLRTRRGHVYHVVQLSHFTDVKAEAQGEEVTNARSHAPRSPRY